MNPQQAKFLVDQYATLMEGEFPATVKVLAAVKDDTRDYKPDEKSRTAWELATHLATVRHLVPRQHHQGRVRVGPGRGQERRIAVPERQRRRRVLQEDVPGEAAGAAHAVARQADADGGLLRVLPVPGRLVHRLGEQPRHPSPRTARRVSPRDGLESAGDLRRQRRRADAGGGDELAHAVYGLSAAGSRQ